MHILKSLFKIALYKSSENLDKIALTSTSEERQLAHFLWHLYITFNSYTHGVAHISQILPLKWMCMFTEQGCMQNFTIFQETYGFNTPLRIWLKGRPKNAYAEPKTKN